MERIIKEHCFDAALQSLPESLRKDIGKFNVFYINHDNDSRFNCQSYSRKGLYKISLLSGKIKLFYADKTMEFEDYALLFSNPNIPYSWEFIGKNHTSFFCVFTEDFIDQFSMIKTYPVFKPRNSPLYELSKEQYDAFIRIFERMQQEIATDFSYKYDVLRTMVLEIIYAALKMKPAERIAQEARSLLKHTDWSIAEIGRCLGFDEISNFINFFKKTERLSPKSYRNTNAG
ncbi:MAG: helix-turn-helix domain-containing protein [Mangrovibacterium sp.]